MTQVCPFNIGVSTIGQIFGGRFCGGEAEATDIAALSRRYGHAELGQKARGIRSVLYFYQFINERTREECFNEEVGALVKNVARLNIDYALSASTYFLIGVIREG